jgi:hypothetical protein
MLGLSTPFRDHYEHSRQLDIEGQMRECADYAQHPDVLIQEFLESYYLVERKLDPEDQDAMDALDADEFVLEPFHDELQLSVRDETGQPQPITCASGAFDPLPTGEHPALRRRGFDYVGTREGKSSIVLGVTETEEETTAYVLLLRALNSFAELAPPFQLARLRRLVIQDRIEPDATFDIHLALSKFPETADETALWQLTRDLAEAFKVRVLATQQFERTLGSIECLFLDPEAPAGEMALTPDWRV